MRFLNFCNSKASYIVFHKTDDFEKKRLVRLPELSFYVDVKTACRSILTGHVINFDLYKSSNRKIKREALVFEAAYYACMECIAHCQSTCLRTHK